MNRRNSTPPPVLHSNKFPSWFKPRGYLHFDTKLGFKSAERIVGDPKAIAVCAFFPLIAFEKKSISLRFDKKLNKPVKKIKVRPIAYASHRDSHIYKYYTEQLSAHYEKYLESSNLNESVLAFRPLGRSNAHFAKIAFDQIKKIGKCTVLAFDIEKFFDNLNHALIKQSWSKIMEVERLPDDHFTIFRSLTHYSSVDKRMLYKTLGLSLHKKHKLNRICSPADFRNKIRKNGLIKPNPNCYGIPQGTPLSGLIANIYMIDVDRQLTIAARKLNGSYMRYCDDILLIIPSDSTEAIEALVSKSLSEARLSLNTMKTKRSCFFMDDKEQLHCDRNLQYLGFEFDGKDIRIRSASLAHHSQTVRRGIRLAIRTKEKKNRERLLDGVAPRKLYRKKLYQRFSHFGNRNFLRYAYRSAEILESEAILRQIKPLWGRLLKRIKIADQG